MASSNEPRSYFVVIIYALEVLFSSVGRLKPLMACPEMKWPDPTAQPQVIQLITA